MRSLLRFVAWVLVFGAGVCAAAGAAPGYQVRVRGNGGGDDANDTGPYTLSGTVVDAMTGAPIRRALVQLIGAHSRLALTDEGGRFRFESLAPGQVRITAQKPGYADLGASRDSSAATTVTIGADTSPVVLKLEPEGGITVEVTGEDGETVENLPVRVLGSEIQMGRRFWNERGGGQTDEKGEYREGGLTPGKYYVSVGPSYRPVGRMGEGANGNDIGYPRVFYPNAAELDGAAAVDVIPGKRLHLAFSMSTVPVYRISGAVVGGPPGEQCWLRLIDSTGLQMAIGVMVNPVTGAFRSGEIPAGFYTLRAMYARRGEDSPVGRLALQVNSNQANVTVAVAQPVAIPVTFRTEGGAEDTKDPTASATVILIDKRPNARPSMAVSRPEGSGDERRELVKGVEPGTYSVDIRANRGWYVGSARYGSVDLVTEDLTVPEGATTETIEITLRNDGASVGGNVRGSGGTMAASGMVVLVPARAPRLAIVVPIVNGSFSSSDLAPGSYRAFALDRVDDLEYTNPEALQEYLTKAQEVTLGPKQEARVDLEILRREK